MTEQPAGCWSMTEQPADQQVDQEDTTIHVVQKQPRHTPKHPYSNNSLGQYTTSSDTPRNYKVKGWLSMSTTQCSLRYATPTVTLR